MDPKITTPPGLYVFGALFYKYGGIDPITLRYLNSCFFAVLNVIALTSIFAGNMNKALLVALQPILFTVSFLFYTETVSLYFLLCTY